MAKEKYKGDVEMMKRPERQHWTAIQYEIALSAQKKSEGNYT
jgi:hypothetical protein